MRLLLGLTLVQGSSTIANACSEATPYSHESVHEQSLSGCSRRKPLITHCVVACRRTASAGSSDTRCFLWTLLTRAQSYAPTRLLLLLLSTRRAIGDTALGETFQRYPKSTSSPITLNLATKMNQSMVLLPSSPSCKAAAAFEPQGFAVANNQIVIMFEATDIGVSTTYSDSISAETATLHCILVLFRSFHMGS